MSSFYNVMILINLKMMAYNLYCFCPMDEPFFSDWFYCLSEVYIPYTKMFTLILLLFCIVDVADMKLSLRD